MFIISGLKMIRKGNRQMIYKSSRGDKVFISWSGGKDSYLSLLLAREKGLNPACLLSFVDEDGQSRSHGLKLAILEQQAQRLDLPLETEAVSWENYQNGFVRAVGRLKKERGITGGVFGDINLEEHRQWVEKTCSYCGIDYNLPLWGMEERKVSEELIRRGGRAMLVALRRDLVDEKWLGGFIGRDFIAYCEEAGISPCGEGGEAHTLVVGGPLFSKPLEFKKGRIKRSKQHAMLDISALREI